MADRLTKKKRSWTMSRVRNRHTKPELIIRSLLHRSGFRFRINYRKLPGVPDIVLPKYKTAIFVNGCFWHRHRNCPKATMPTSNEEYWKNKFEKNISRDIKVKKELRQLNWRVISVWECEIMKNPLSVLNFIIRRFGIHNRRNYLKAMNRREIMKIAERKSRYYLDGKSGTYGK